MKIRIGNDINLNVNISAPGEDPSAINVQSVEILIVNDTEKQKIEDELNKKTRFIGRFPFDPFLDEYEPTAYNINCSGNPKYLSCVANKYCGFGVNPKWCDILPCIERNKCTYEAKVVRTEDPTVVTAYFPAEAQLAIGHFSVIAVVTLYNPGFDNNRRKVTIDYSDVFELVATSEEADPDFTGEIDVE